MRAPFLLALMGLFSLAGCSSDEAPQSQVSAGEREFGKRCQETEDCASRLCVRVGTAPGICSKPCARTSDCPSALNWDCASPSGVDFRVCACLPDAGTEVCGDDVDNDCDGEVDDCLTCDGVQVPPNDPEHCGSCQNACRSDQVCDDGACKCSNVSLENCADGCVDTDTDPYNCGGCGHACLPQQQCSDGECSCANPTKPDTCPDLGCVNLSTDDGNCGACGNACPDHLRCSSGACGCPSPDEPDDCPGAGCIDLQSNDLHCGACDQACPPGQSCVDGNCGCPDPAYPDACNGAGCVNLNVDPDNCGTCGQICTGGKACAMGQCVCPAFLPTDCNGVCTNVSTDASNCGSCANACPVGQICHNADCGCSAPGYTACGAQCVDTSSNPVHCGSCDSPCTAGEQCLSGNCSCVSTLYCGGVCVPVDDDENCGACSNACPTGQSCFAGACTCVASGLTVCSGTCVDVQNDASNCGACGKSCKSGEACAAGVCTCDPGEAWCVETGTCTNLQSDAEHCGACGNACLNSQICSSGACDCPDVGGQYCASTGKCEDLYSSAEHCGGCDSACPFETHCNGGTCRCDELSFALCGTNCVDLDTDVTHCGACDAACESTKQCILGVCKCGDPAPGTVVDVTDASSNANWFDMAFNGQHIGLAYKDYEGFTNCYSGCSDLYFTLLNPDGSRAWSQDLAITNFKSEPYTSNKVGIPSVVWTGSEWGVLWYEQEQVTGFTTIHTSFQRLSPDGTPLAPKINLTDTTPGGAAFAAGPADPVRLAHSPTFGYAMVSPAKYTRLDFQRLGQDGTQLEPVVQMEIADWTTEHIAKKPVLTASPDGWGILEKTDYGLVFITLDGLAAYPPAGLFIDEQLHNTYDTPPLLHDGTTWLSVWPKIHTEYIGMDIERTPQFLVARGDTLNHLQVAITGPSDASASAVEPHHPVVAMRGDELTIAYAPFGYMPYQSEALVSRLSIPADPTVAPTLLSDPYLIPIDSSFTPLATPNLVYTSPDTLVYAWFKSNTTPSTIHDIRLDLLGCP
jgi:Stigma-specific protein, Stig1